MSNRGKTDVHRSSIAAFAVAWLCVAGAVDPVRGEQPTPRVEIDQREVHVGTLVRGQTADAEFTIRNAGDAELRIERAKPGCGCTVVSFDESIPPGGRGVIRAALDSATLSGDVGRGITVSTNDPQRPKLFLVVRAEVLSSVDILPSPTIRLSNRVAGQHVGRAIVRRDPFETGEVRLAGLDSSVPWLSVRSERLDARRPAGDGLPIAYPGDWLVEVRLGEDLDYGAREATVSFETGLSKQPTGTIEIRTDLRPPVSLSEERIELPDATSSGTVLVSVRRDLDPEQLRVESDDGALALRLERSGSRHYKLHVRWKEARSTGSWVTFRVGDEQLRMPVGSPAGSS